MITVSHVSRHSNQQAFFRMWQHVAPPGDLCHRGDDDEFLLLCDGRRGRCPGACHSYCDGLGRQIPRGRWLCFACRPARQPAQPARRPKAAAKGRGRRAERQAEALLNATMAVNQLPVQPASADLVMSDAAHGTASQALPNVSVKVEQGKEMQLGHSERLPKQETIRPRVKRERPDAQPSGASAVDTTTDGDRSSAEPAAPEATVQQNAAINSLVKEELEEAEMEKFAGWDVDAKKMDMAKVKEEALPGRKQDIFLQMNALTRERSQQPPALVVHSDI